MRKKLCRVSRSRTLGKAPRTDALKSHTRGHPLLIAPAHTRALSLPPLPLTASRRRVAPAPPLLAPRRPGSAASSPPAGKVVPCINTSLTLLFPRFPHLLSGLEWRRWLDPTRRCPLPSTSKAGGLPQLPCRRIPWIHRGGCGSSGIFILPTDLGGTS